MSDELFSSVFLCQTDAKERKKEGGKERYELRQNPIGTQIQNIRGLCSLFLGGTPWMGAPRLIHALVLQKGLLCFSLLYVSRVGICSADSNKLRI